MIPWFDIELPSITLPVIGPLTIHAFGILVVIGIAVGARLTQRRGRQLGLAEPEVDAMITSVLIAGFLVAHLFHVVAYRAAGSPVSLLDLVNPTRGLSSFGGFAGALIGLFAWCRLHRQPVMPYADSLAFGLAAGWLFGRLGCFTAHDHPGRLTGFFLAVRYPGGARHDLGLDEALFALAMTAFFLWLARAPRPLGLYVTTLTLAYAPTRFFFDFLRATDLAEVDPRYAGLTPAQWGCIAVLGAGIALLVWLMRAASGSRHRDR